MEPRRQINPHQFVYHVSKRENRRSIYKNGLWLSSSKSLSFKDAIFANNTDHIGSWFPFCLDSMDYLFSDDFDFYWNTIVPTFDVWRIDTREAGSEWFIDDRIGWDSSNGTYVYTMEPVKTEALKLFKIDPEEKIIIKKTNGVHHVSLKGGMKANALIRAKTNF